MRGPKEEPAPQSFAALHGADTLPLLPSSGRQHQRTSLFCPRGPISYRSPEVPKLGRALPATRHENRGEVCRGQGPERFGKPTIFRPRYSQPGRTDSRKAFLWAPSENKAWPLSGLSYAFPGPSHPGERGKGSGPQDP